MRKILLIIFGLILCSNAFAKTKFSEIKKALKEDDYGNVRTILNHQLNSRKAINPTSISDFSIIGEKSIRFELNHGECGREPVWNDCETDRERVELVFGKEKWKKEKWYRFYIFLPEDYNLLDPAFMSLIQWKRFKPSLVLVHFRHTKDGLIFERHSQTFEFEAFNLKKNEELYGNWTEIIFATNWHPDPQKGFMKVWIDGKLKIDFKGASNTKKGKELSLRYGLYSSSMSRYKTVFQQKEMPQRVIFFDGVKEEKNCEKLIGLSKCDKLNSQSINEYEIFFYGKYDKMLQTNSIFKFPLSYLK